MGPSGSGQDHVPRPPVRARRPDEGKVTWKGRRCRRISAEESLTLRRTGMGIVFQSFGLLPTLSAAGERGAAAPGRRRGPRRSHGSRSALLARAAGPRPTAGDNRTFELSAGQQQRVAVARALITEPEVLLADEPIAEVDTENADLILEALWDVVGRGGAVLAATHNPEALRYANRVVLFHDGRVQAEGTPEELAGRLTTD